MTFKNKDWDGKIEERNFYLTCESCGEMLGYHSYAGCPPARVSLTQGQVGNMLDLVDHRSGTVSDGSTASYYELPDGATELQHLISHRDMNAQIGEIFRACYRYGQASHSGRLRDAKKIKFYAEAEIARLEKREARNG